MDNAYDLTRRSFLGSVSALGFGGLASVIPQQSYGEEIGKTEEIKSPIMASFPLLQNVTENSASISWAVTSSATGWVEWGRTPELGKVARNSVLGLNPYDSEFLSARIIGLAPNTRYYYRVACCPFVYRTAYDKTAGEPQYSDIYSFETTGGNGDVASFVVMNDTHNELETIRAHIARAMELNPDFLLWNGDLCCDYMNAERVQKHIANPTNNPYAAECPLVFSPGNHDRRGLWARNLPKCLTTWIQEDPQFYELGWNGAFRKGPLAMIVMDTGEDKPDWHPAWSRMANFEPYRELQTAWLAKILEKPEINTAPFIVVSCHIPLFSEKNNVNPGNVLDQWAYIQWPAAQMWGSLLKKYGVQLLITAHLHEFIYSAPTEDRPWAQVVGGGPVLSEAYSLQVKVTREKMTLTSEKLDNHSIVGSWEFEPRC